MATSRNSIGRDLAHADGRRESEDGREHQLQVLSELMSDCCWVRWEYPDGSSHREWVSGSIFRLTGYHPDEFESVGREGLIHPDDMQQALCHVAGPEGTSELEFRIITRSGDVRWLHERMHVSPVKNGVVRVYGATRDITERKLAEAALYESREQLHQSRKMDALGKLAGGVAHDLNNLLTVILGFAELLSKTTTPGSSSSSSALGITDAASRAAALTRQLLAFGRKQTMQPRVMSPNILIRDMERLLERLLPENIALVLVLDRDVPGIKIDPGQLEQVLVNMVANARDAISEGGTITIESKQELAHGSSGGQPDSGAVAEAVIRVHDDGCGMDARTVTRIFEPFFTTKPPGVGTGLGLAASYGTVSQSGGRIDVTSEPGKGTVVTIRLPEAEGLDTQRNTDDSGSRPAGGSETILLVEDEPLLRKVLNDSLARMGYHVLEAESPADAIRLSEQHPGDIQLVVTDVVMPEMTGIQLAGAVRARRQGIRVLFISGHTFETMGSGGIVDPEVNFLQKPFSPLELAHRVRKILSE